MHRAQDAAILGLLLEGARRALVGDQAHTQRYLGYVITSLRRGHGSPGRRAHKSVVPHAGAGQHAVGCAVTTYRPDCGLCGRPFAILIPPGVEETERDKLCSECAALPAPPDGDSDASAR
jgi:hypothetical protein